MEQLSLFGESETTALENELIYCRIKDWSSKEVVEYKTLLKR